MTYLVVIFQTATKNCQKKRFHCPWVIEKVYYWGISGMLRASAESMFLLLATYCVDAV